MVASTSASNYKNDVLQSTATTTNGYTWGRAPAGGTQSRLTSVNVVTDYVSGTDTNYTSTYAYNTLGALSSVSIQDGRPRTVTFVTDLNGQILQRDENDNNTATGDPRELHYYMNGMQLGDVSNNGTSDVDYVTAIARHTQQQGTGPFEGGSWTASSHADFDQSYDPVNGLNYEAIAGRYVARDGDTLMSVAAAVWGDASLWYKIAEANGMSGSETLVAGMSLIIPNKVAKFFNSVTRFSPKTA